MSLTVIARLAAAAAAVVILGAGPSRAIEPGADVSAYTTGSAPAAGDPAFAALRAKAAGGPLRVIVKLGVELKDEDAIGVAAADAQAKTLAKAQADLAARTLRGAVAAKTGRSFRYIPYMSMTVDAAELERLLADPGVRWVGEDEVSRANKAGAAWDIGKINADDVWKDGHDGRGQVIAILDTGMDTKHPMFEGKVVEEICRSKPHRSVPNAYVCPNGTSEQDGPGAARFCSVEGCDHGTHVAATAGGGSWRSLSGVAPGAKLILGQVFHAEKKDDGVVDSYAFEADILSALEKVYSYRNKYEIASVNMSLGHDPTDRSCDSRQPAYAEMLAKFRVADIAVVVSSGNDHLLGVAIPACISTAVSVGATDIKDAVDPYSNHSQLLSVLAPGIDIESAVPGGKSGLMSGTSMAAPHVAGAFAVLRSAFPKATVGQLLRALQCSGKPVTYADIEKPRIDLAAAIDALTANPKKPKTFTFDKKKDGDAWKTPKNAPWAVRAGSFGPKVAPSAPRYENYAFIKSCAGDLEVAFDVKNGGTGQEYGVLLKSQIDDKGIYVSGYRMSVSSSLMSDGWNWRASIRRYDQYDAQGHGEIAYLASTGCLGLTRGAPIKDVQMWNTGYQLNIAVNGEVILTVSDQTFTTGNVALFTGSASGRTPVAFDKVSIASKDKKLIEKDPAPSAAPVASVEAFKGDMGPVRPQC